VEIADLRDAAGKDLALGPAKRRRLSQMFQGLPPVTNRREEPGAFYDVSWTRSIAA
jgi:hypothetical protein